MAYNLAGIRSRILNDKLADSQFPPATIDAFINDTQREIFNRYELPFQEKVFAGNLPSGSYIFTVPTDYQQAQSFVVTAPTGSVKDLSHSYVNFRDFNAWYPTPSTTSPGAPDIWTIYGNKMYFSRPTDQAYTVSMFYLKAPTILAADGDVPEIPEEFSELLVLGGYYRALARNEDFDQAAFIRDGDYADQVDLMVARLGKRQSMVPSMIRQTNRNQGRRTRRHH